MEADIFYDFLYSEEYPQFKFMIYQCFPDLKEKLDLAEQKEHKKIIEEYIKNTRETNQENLQKSYNFIKNEVDRNGKNIVQILANLMDYKDITDDYILVPTIFPVSPFKNNTFFFSIYSALKGKVEQPSVLAVSVHEISHIILLEILKRNTMELNRDVLYFIKELIAPVLVCHNDFGNIYKKEIIGNYNVLQIYFNVDGEVISAFDYFSKIFTKNITENKNFLSFLKQIIVLCNKIQIEISNKMAFDNKHGRQIMTEPELLKKYQEPIYIKK